MCNRNYFPARIENVWDFLQILKYYSGKQSRKVYKADFFLLQNGFAVCVSKKVSRIYLWHESFVQYSMLDRHFEIPEKGDEDSTVMKCSREKDTDLGSCDVLLEG